MKSAVKSWNGLKMKARSMDEIFLNKRASIERCLKRIKEEYDGNPERMKDQTRQDAVVLNIQRACETAIDLAMHVVSLKRLGVPKQSREAFQLLETAGHLTPDLSLRMKKMVGFRNIAVHDYQSLDPIILTHILKDRLGDFEEFLAAIQKALP
jgi:uncharacterized protein YutE (UPF0331/DUF86 family)